MAHDFNPGSLISIHDYNQIISNLNDIYGLGNGNLGYGSVVSPASELSPKVAGVDTVQNEDWLILRQAFILDRIKHWITPLL